MAGTIVRLGETMSRSKVVIILILVTFGTFGLVKPFVIRADDCEISIKYTKGDLKTPQPLILTREKNRTSFCEPIDKNSTLNLWSNEKLFIACPGEGNAIQGIPSWTNLTELEATCISGTIFTTGTEKFNFTSVSCKYRPKHEARRTETKCYENGTIVKIGFELRESFLETINICWNNQSMMSYWSKFNLSTKIAGFQAGYPRPYNWLAADFYGKYNISVLYKTATQMKTIAMLLNSDKLAQQYINLTKSLMMSRGHLSAKADFVYGLAQTSTFWYLNAAPQWQSFNGGNWNSLEDNVRTFAGTRSSDLEVYTGIHGQMSLNDINGNRVPIYLYAKNNERAFPVPLFYWKVIYDPSTKQGTAFVGVNDPWAQDINEEMFICEDIADQIKWLTWEANSIIKGISYACTIDDLRKSVASVPKLDVDGILA